jgi:tRNA-dihydrouridine synthase A
MTTTEMRRNHSYRISIAPMMDWTDRHCRVFHRVMTRRALLYTEMLTTGAVIPGDRTFRGGPSGGLSPTARIHG